MLGSVKSQLYVLTQLFWVFFKIGPSTFGGGYAMIPVIEQEIVEKRKWLERSEMNDLMSLAGTAPGGVGVNASAFLGYRMAKIPGAIAAVLGITLPTFFIVFMISFFYSLFEYEPKVQAAFMGIHASIIGLIAAAAYKMAKTALFDLTTIILATVSVFILILTGLNPTYMILIGLVIGIVIVHIRKQFGMSITTEKKFASANGIIEYYI